MTKEEAILLKDLCARVPYHPKGHVVNACNGAECDEWLTCATFTMFTNVTNNCRLYLRPMSSMTEEEKEELLIYVLDNKEDCKQFKINDEGAIESIDNNIFQWVYFDSDTTSRYVDWLNKNHFDYRGLIPKELALEATENMYKEQNMKYERE